MKHGPRLLSSLPLAILALAPRAAAQVVEPDPYTRGEPQRIASAGYVSFGPFELGDGVSTRDVEYEIATALRWIETAHFRLGCGLAERPLPDESSGRRPLYEECKELHRTLPAVKAQPTSLDPWLQAHLFAARLEALHAEMLALLDVDDAWFAGNGTRQDRGMGPFLGCDQKFVVLLFEREADLSRYLRRYHDCKADQPWLARYERREGLVFATAADVRSGAIAGPVAMHAHVVRSVAMGLLDAFACSDVTVPFWWREGLGHVVARRIDEDFVDTSDGLLPARADGSVWAERLRSRVRHELLPPLADLLCWPDGKGRTEIEHAAMWSFVAFLLERDRDGERDRGGDGRGGRSAAGRAGQGPEGGERGAARFCRLIRERPLRTRFAPQRLALEWHELAFAEAFGQSVRELEQAWHRALQAPPRQGK